MLAACLEAVYKELVDKEGRSTHNLPKRTGSEKNHYSK